MNINPICQMVDEMPQFHKRRTFMKLFLDVHSTQMEDTVVSLKESYYQTELLFFERFGGKGYRSDESFLRSWYYHLGSKQVRH